jgi:hypothetical protein
MKKLSEHQKLILVSSVALASVFYLFKKSKETGSSIQNLDGLNVDINGDKLSSSLGKIIRNNPEIIKKVGKSVLNNEKVKKGAKNLASKAFVKLMS